MGHATPGFMAWNRTLFVVSLVASLALSVGLSLLGWLVFDMPLFTLFLFLPFLPILFRPAAGEPGGSPRRGGGPASASATEPVLRRCPRCGWGTAAADLHYCPRDGERLGS